MGTLRQKYVLQLPEAQARYPMNQIWQPTGWQQLIKQAETHFSNFSVDRDNLIDN